jgi:uncharacterized damage-inducible protein DinB
MTATPGQAFLQFSIAKLEQLCGRIEICLSQLTDEQVWWRAGESLNAVGNLVLHLCGNVRQWIGSGVAAQPDTRLRDAEFAARDGASREDLGIMLRTTVTEALAILRALPEQRLLEAITVQGYRLTILEAVYHVVEHFSQHTGQILLLTKTLTGRELGFYRHLGTPSHSEKTP